MKITIHRGTHEIGGSCVEVQAGDTSLLIDFGLPLVNPDGSPFDDDWKDCTVHELLGRKILPDIPGLYDDGECTVAAILLSHAHQDHFGLGQFVRPDVPIYTSNGTKRLISATGLFFSDTLRDSRLTAIKAFEPLTIGPFQVTAHPVDHSAPDAFAFEIAAGGKKLFYTGDLRAHGYKSGCFQNLLKRPPEKVDALLMEGSTLGRADGEYAYSSEKDVEKALVHEIQSTDNIVLLFCASQNLDRIISAFKAAKRTGRTLVIDLYTAFVLDQLKELSPNIPQYHWDGIKVSFRNHHKAALEKSGQGAFVKAIAFGHHGIKSEDIPERCSEIVMLARANRFLSSTLNSLKNLDNIKMIWSMWSGYLTGQDVFSLVCEENNLAYSQIHTSGHAQVDDLKHLAQAFNPAALIPVHTFYPEDYGQFGVPVTMLEDGEAFSF